MWEYDGGDVTKGKNEIKMEKVSRKSLDSQEEFEVLIDRTSDSFLFCGTKLPKLQLDKPSITLLKEEEKISPLYETFSKVQRREFHREGLKDAIAIQNVPPELLNAAKSKDGILELW